MKVSHIRASQVSQDKNSLGLSRSSNLSINTATTASMSTISTNSLVNAARKLHVHFQGDVSVREVPRYIEDGIHTYSKADYRKIRKEAGSLHVNFGEKLSVIEREAPRWITSGLDTYSDAEYKYFKKCMEQRQPLVNKLEHIDQRIEELSNGCIMLPTMVQLLFLNLNKAKCVEMLNKME